MSDHDPTHIPARLGHVELPDQEFIQTVDKDVRLVLAHPDNSVGDAWASLLKQYPAHWFATLTFRPQKHFTDKHTKQVRVVNRTGRNGSIHGEAADKAFRYFVCCINREVYGPAWLKRPHHGIQWARGSEFHKDGRLHFHALLSAPTADLSHLASRYAWHEWWYREFGRNQIEQPRSQHEVAGYVSKYVVKDGEVDFSPNFGQWQPPKLDYSRALLQQRNLPGVPTEYQAPAADAMQRAGRGSSQGQSNGP